MRLLRTLSTGRLLAAVAVVVAVAVGGSAIAIAASRSAGPTPPAKPLARAIHDSLSAPAVAGITARIKFTNRLFPSGALLGGNGSALMSGASGRLWLTGDGRGRLELQADAGDAQIVWNDKLITVYDASTNTVYKLARSNSSSTTPAPGDNGNAPSVTQIERLSDEARGARGRLGGPAHQRRGPTRVQRQDFPKARRWTTRLRRARVGCRPRRSAPGGDLRTGWLEARAGAHCDGHLIRRRLLEQRRRVAARRSEDDRPERAE